MIPRTLFKPLHKMAHRMRTLIIVLSILLVGSMAGIGYLVYSMGQQSPSLLTVSDSANGATHSPHKIEKPSGPAYSFKQIGTIFNALIANQYFVGKGVYVVAWDTRDHAFYDLLNINADTPYNSASVTKLVTALSLAKYAESTGYVDPVSATADSESVDLPSQLFKKDDLFAAMLIQSSNQAAYSLAKPFGIPKFLTLMNSEANHLGLTHSIFRDPSGLDYDSKETASYMSPRDVARVSFELVNKYPDLTKLSSNAQYDITNKQGKVYRLHNTNPLVKTTPNVLLSKTGFTNLAGGNLTMVLEPKPGVLVSAVVMHSTMASRVPDMQKLVDTINKTFDLYDSIHKAS